MTARCLGICVSFPRHEPSVCESARPNHDPAEYTVMCQPCALAVALTAALTEGTSDPQYEKWGEDTVRLKLKEHFFLTLLSVQLSINWTH